MSLFRQLLEYSAAGGIAARRDDALSQQFRPQPRGGLAIKVKSVGDFQRSGIFLSHRNNRQPAKQKRADNADRAATFQSHGHSPRRSISLVDYRTFQFRERRNITARWGGA